MEGTRLKEGRWEKGEEKTVMGIGGCARGLLYARKARLIAYRAPGGGVEQPTVWAPVSAAAWEMIRRDVAQVPGDGGGSPRLSA